MKIVYYAHPMSWYNTRGEREDISALTEPSTLVINPNSQLFQKEVDRLKANNEGHHVMEVFTDYIIDKADIVAFRSFADGHVGSGVALEVFTAFIHGKEIWQVSDDGVDKNPSLNWSKLLTVSETKRRVRKGEL